jgi:hypothetical protein
VYVVPNGFEARIERVNGTPHLEVSPSEAVTAPSFDALFESAADVRRQRGRGAVVRTRHRRHAGHDGGCAAPAASRWFKTAFLPWCTTRRVRPETAEVPSNACPSSEIAERIQMLMRAEPASRS